MESISNKIIVNFISEKTNNDFKKKLFVYFHLIILTGLLIFMIS